MTTTTPNSAKDALAERAVPLNIELRDWFAGQALIGMHLLVEPNDIQSRIFATSAYLYADAMLAERKKTGDSQ